VILTVHRRQYVEIKCQLDATEVFIADLIACSICFGHHYAHHQEFKSSIQWLLRAVFCAVVFLSSWSGVELTVMRPVCRMLFITTLPYRITPKHPITLTVKCPNMENEAVCKFRSNIKDICILNTIQICFKTT